jgi:hypothetical protein
MRHSLIDAVLVIVAAAGWLFYPQNASPPTQMDVVQPQSIAARSSSFAVHQAECMKQARDEFRRDGWDSELHSHFVEHYNERLKICFVEINFSAIDGQGRLLVNRSLSDARGRDYADYVSASESGQKPSLTSSVFCEIVLSSGERMDCNSAGEFEAFVADYMK